jgi:hypothetical protein
MNKIEALGILGRITESAVRHYQVVNGDRRGSAPKAAKDELKAANDLLKALGVTDATEKEISAALGW